MRIGAVVLSHGRTHLVTHIVTHLVTVSSAQVCAGMGVVKRMGSVATDASDRPTVEVKILRCGVESNGVHL